MTLPTPDRASRVVHATLVFEREIGAPAHAVFEALADADARSTWGNPSPTATVIYDLVNFSEGAEEKYRCGSRDNPNIHGTTRYLEIVPDQRIVSSETLEMEGRRLSASFSTIELVPSGRKTRLKQTTHVASFVGASMIDGFTQGNDASLDNLVGYVEKQHAS